MFMQRANGILLNLIFFFQVLLLFLLFFESRVVLPSWLQIAGRLHPAILHVPIGLLVFLGVLLLARNEFKEKPFRRILLILLTSIAITTSITALFGFFLSLQSGYDEGAIVQHKIVGILLSFLCYVLLLIYQNSDRTTPAFYTLTAIAIGFMFFAGHSGGSITHGGNFVFAPLTQVAAGPEENASIYQSVIFPVLEKKCVACHNEAKAKGKLIMTSTDDFLRGGEHGKEWIEGKPEESRLIKFIHLPLSDDNHMPPDGKPQLSKQEIVLLEQWIKNGADFNVTADALKESDSLRMIAASMETTGHKKVQDYAFSAVSESTIRKLTSPGRVVFPLFQNSPALQADFFMAESFNMKALEELEPVKEQLVILNLSKMPVTDDGLSVIAGFRNLERLNINFTEISGAGLSRLRALEKLQSLSLAGTNVDANGIKVLFDLPQLTELYVWNTKITEEDKSTFEKQFPQVTVVTTQFKNDKILRLGKPGLANEGIVRQGELVALRHSMPAVKIYYTLDGTQPDTTKGDVFRDPFKLESTKKVKAIACKDGWYCSSMFEITCFLDGYTPEKTELLTKTDSYFRGDGVKALTDKEIGFIEVLNAPPWIGYKETDFAAGFDFGSKPPEVKEIVISYADSPGGSFFPPEEVEVWGGSGRERLRLITSLRPQMPEKYRAQQVEALRIPITPSQFPYYKIVAKPIAKLPAWHNSKGKKGWLLIDEVIFN